MKQTFELPIALPGLNGSKGLIRQHWTSAIHHWNSMNQVITLAGIAQKMRKR